MKKIIGFLCVSALLAMSVSAGTIIWGSNLENESDFAYFNDNTANPFSGTAYLFLLTASDQTVQWNAGSGTWNLNGATFIAYAGNYVDGSPIPGTWGGLDGQATADANITPTFWYQAVLLTAPAGATSITGGGTQGLGGHWASVAPEQVFEYANIGGEARSGKLYWQNISGSWAPVAAVPEPATMALFGLGGLALVIRRKMRKEA